MIRKLKKTDDFESVAAIVYQTDDFIFPYLFGKNEKAIKRIAKLVALEKNPFSYLRSYIDVTEQNVIRGILTEEQANNHNKANQDYMNAFSIPFLIGLFFKQALFFPIFQHKFTTGTYIQTLTVDAKHRGKGIGSALLKNAIKRAQVNNNGPLFLDVAIKNKVALTLYQKHGFIINKTKRIWWFFPTNYWMIKEIKTKKNKIVIQ